MNDKELLKVLNKEKSYTEEDLLLFIYDLRKENARLKDRIERAINILNNPWSFESGNKEVDEITYQKKREVIDLLK